MKGLFQILLFFLVVPNCYSQENPRDYYYQFGKEKETKIYQYINANKSTDVIYWKVITDPVKKEIITYGIDKNFREMNKLTERIVDGGAIMVEFIVYDTNLLGVQTEKKAKVLKNKVYSWNKDEACVISYRLNFDEIGDVEFQKAREFQEFDTLKLDGKEYQVAKFLDTSKISLLKRGESMEELTNSTYAKGLGMIKYKTNGSDGIEEMEFKRLFTQEEFDAYKKN